MVDSNIVYCIAMLIKYSQLTRENSYTYTSPMVHVLTLILSHDTCLSTVVIKGYLDGWLVR